MYLDNNKIKLNPKEGELDYFIDAYIKLEGIIIDGAQAPFVYTRINRRNKSYYANY